MSLARLLMALFTTRSTRSMMGAASLRSLRPLTGSKISSSTRRARAVSPSGFSPFSPRRGRVFGEIDEREPELKFQGLGNLLLGREVHAYKHDAHALASTLMFCQGRLQIVLGDEAGLYQALANLLTHSIPLNARFQSRNSILRTACRSKQHLT